MQIRQAIQAQQQHQFQPQQQLQQDGSRQMSPPSSAQPRQQQQHPSPGQGLPMSVPNANVNAAVLSSLGSNQNINALQNSNHPFMSYMNQAVPDFPQMPLQKMQMV
jgi:phosphatidate phosphatase APP1